jgi:hypothetical protein
MNVPTEQPKGYVGLNILAIFGCTIAGIIGLIFGLQVKSKWEAGDYAGAESASKIAKITGIIGVVGFVLLIIYIIAMVALGGALLRAARRVGVDTPVTARIVTELERINRAAVSATS